MEDQTLTLKNTSKIIVSEHMVVEDVLFANQYNFIIALKNISNTVYKYYRIIEGMNKIFEERISAMINSLNPICLSVIDFRENELDVVIGVLNKSSVLVCAEINLGSYKMKKKDIMDFKFNIKKSLTFSIFSKKLELKYKNKLIYFIMLGHDDNLVQIYLKEDCSMIYYDEKDSYISNYNKKERISKIFIQERCEDQGFYVGWLTDDAVQYELVSDATLENFSYEYSINKPSHLDKLKINNLMNIGQNSSLIHVPKIINKLETLNYTQIDNYDLDYPIQAIFTDNHLLTISKSVFSIFNLNYDKCRVFYYELEKGNVLTSFMLDSCFSKGYKLYVCFIDKYLEVKVYDENCEIWRHALETKNYADAISKTVNHDAKQYIYMGALQDYMNGVLKVIFSYGYDQPSFNQFYDLDVQVNDLWDDILYDVKYGIDQLEVATMMLFKERKLDNEPLRYWLITSIFRKQYFENIMFNNQHHQLDPPKKLLLMNYFLTTLLVVHRKYFDHQYFRDQIRLWGDMLLSWPEFTHSYFADVYQRMLSYGLLKTNYESMLMNAHMYMETSNVMLEEYSLPNGRVNAILTQPYSYFGDENESANPVAHGHDYRELVDLLKRNSESKILQYSKSIKTYAVHLLKELNTDYLNILLENKNIPDLYDFEMLRMLYKTIFTFELSEIKKKMFNTKTAEILMEYMKKFTKVYYDKKIFDDYVFPKYEYYLYCKIFIKTVFSLDIAKYKNLICDFIDQYFKYECYFHEIEKLILTNIKTYDYDFTFMIKWYKSKKQYERLFDYLIDKECSWSQIFKIYNEYVKDTAYHTKYIYNCITINYFSYCEKQSAKLKDNSSQLSDFWSDSTLQNIYFKNIITSEDYINKFMNIMPLDIYYEKIKSSIDDYLNNCKSLKEKNKQLHNEICTLQQTTYSKDNYKRKYSELKCTVCDQSIFKQKGIVYGCGHCYHRGCVLQTLDFMQLHREAGEAPLQCTQEMEEKIEDAYKIRLCIRYKAINSIKWVDENYYYWLEIFKIIQDYCFECQGLIYKSNKEYFSLDDVDSNMIPLETDFKSHIGNL